MPERGKGRTLALRFGRGAVKLFVDPDARQVAMTRGRPESIGAKGSVKMPREPLLVMDFENEQSLDVVLDCLMTLKREFVADRTMRAVGFRWDGRAWVSWQAVQESYL